MKLADYRGRLAPSPTGLLHLGHARTFLVAWLRAKAARGTVVLRVDDLDQPRVVAGATQQACRDLEWLGLVWDEGPLRQSDRLERYHAAFAALQSNGHVFACSCSRREVANVADAPHGEQRFEPIYPGTCRNGPTHPDRTPSFRFRAPAIPPQFREQAATHDGVPVPFGDFVLRRADGVFSYQLATAVDDAEMNISEVVRGADLIASTPRQVALLQAMGHRVPDYLHVPLLLGSDGRKLSKRYGALPINAFHEAGWEPEAVLAGLARTLGIQVGPKVSALELVPMLSENPLGLVESAMPDELSSVKKDPPHSDCLG